MSAFKGAHHHLINTKIQTDEKEILHVSHHPFDDGNFHSM